MKVLITQPKFMPSYEFLRRLSYVNVFVLMDQTMLDHRDYEQRCKVRFNNGVNDEDRMLRIPVEKKKTIGETKIIGEFVEEHENILKEYYKTKKPIYRELIPEGRRESYLEFMVGHYELIRRMFGLDFEIRLASEFVSPELKGSDEIISILQKIGATDYYSGINCINYGVNKELLQEKGINLHLIDFYIAKEQILQETGINSSYSILDALNKGILTWQK